MHSQQVIIELVPCFGWSILLCTEEVGGILEDVGPWSVEGMKVELFNKGIEYWAIFFVERRANGSIRHKGRCECLEVRKSRKKFGGLVKNPRISSFDIEVDSFDRVFDMLLTGIFVS